MRDGLDQQYRAVASGHWPLIRYDPVVRGGRRQPVPARLAAAADVARRLPQGRAALPRAGQRRPGRGRAPARPRPAGGRPALADLRGDGHPQRRATSRPTPAGSADGPLDQLHGPRPAQPARGVGVAAVLHRSTASGAWPTPASARSCCSRCSRSSCARRPRERTARRRPAEASPRRWTTSPPSSRRTPGPRRYLSLLERAAAAVDVPVIASLNGVTPEGWTDYARAMQDAGAAAIELNIYYLPGDPHISGRDVEQRHIDVLQRVKDAVTVPVAVKLSPYFSSHRRDGAAPRRGRRRRAGAVQPLPAAGHRSRARSRSCRESNLSSHGGRPAGRGRGSRCCAARLRASLAATAGVEVPPTSPGTCSPVQTS